MNTIRVFLHYALYQQNSTQFLTKLDKLLSIADTHKMKTMFVLFDDVWNPEFNMTGKQPEPIQFVHNSRWVQCPGKELLFDPSKWSQILEPYTTGVINRFKSDPRVLMWDLYNEPGNINQDCNETDEKLKHSLALLKSVFDWARSCDPSQPLTSGVWTFDNQTGATDIRQFQLDNADVMTFHNYDPLEGLIDVYRTVKATTRYPFICTEYMARTVGSRFETSLPFMKAYGIGAINWGLVSGKTNTIYPWDSLHCHYNGTDRNCTEWFHDVLYDNGTVYNKSEQHIITSLIELSSDTC